MKFSELNVVHVLLVEFRESIRQSIPQIIALLSDWGGGAGADALSKLSEQGDISSFLT